MADFGKTKKDIRTLPPSKRERANKLLEKAVFMDRQMTQLQEELEEHGWTEEYQNGANQSGVKKSSAADVYMNLSKVFLSTMRQLEDMLEAVPEVTDSGKLSAFLKNG